MLLRGKHAKQYCFIWELKLMDQRYYKTFPKNVILKVFFRHSHFTLVRSRSKQRRNKTNKHGNATHGSSNANVNDYFTLY